MLAKKCHSPGRSRTLLLAQRAFAEVLLPPPGYSISQRPSPLRNSPFMSFVRPSIHRTRPFISFTSCFKNEMSMEVRLSSHCEGGLVSLLTASYKDFRAERKSFSAARMRAHDLPRSLEPDHGLLFKPSSLPERTGFVVFPSTLSEAPPWPRSR